MSSNKRRKIDAQVVPLSAVSAVSALAARRRLATNAVVKEPSPSPEPDETPTRTNSFNVLQSLKNQAESARSPKKGGIKAGSNRGGARHTASQGSRPSTEDSGLDTTESLNKRVAYSSFSLSKSNCRTTSYGVALRLKDAERFIVLGNFGIRVLAGEVTIFGSTIRPSETAHWVHAPQCHAIPVIRTSEKTSLELHNDPNADGLRRMGRLSPLFRKLWNEPLGPTEETKFGVGETFQIICYSDDTPKRCILEELSSPPAWNRKIASLLSTTSGSSAHTTMVCGPKSAGKSTFSKLLTNRLLTADNAASGNGAHGVAVLDLDPGQPEYAPSGTLSLVHVIKPNLSAPFTHTSLHDPSYRVMRCHALASVTPASAPEHYLECVFDLIDFHRRLLRNCPLLINTPGWILGTGQDLLVEIISRVNPNEVIYMSEDGPVDVVEILRSVTKRAFTTLPSHASEFASRTAAHLRAMQAMSYFHLADQDLIRDGTQRPRWISLPLSDISPLQIRYSGPQSGILGILSYDYQPPSQLLAENINGMILAAVDIEDPAAFRDLIGVASSKAAPADVMDTQIDFDDSLVRLVSRTAEGLPYIVNANDMALSPRYSRTIGLVLIRGIDTVTKTLQVITPIPLKKIEEVKSQGRHIVLVHGKFDPPTWAYTEQLYESTSQEDGGHDKTVDEVDQESSDDDDQDESDEEEGEDETNNGTVNGVEVAHYKAAGGLPWVEVLRGNQKRPVGSRVWRVRRDLGRSMGD